MQVVVGATPAVAGEDAEDQVGAAGQDEDDDLGGGEDQLVPENSLLHSRSEIKSEIQMLLMPALICHKDAAQCK